MKFILKSPLRRAPERFAKRKRQNANPVEGQASIRNIKEYAEDRLGLQKLDRSQIQYIQIQTEDEVVVEEPDQNIFVQIKRKFNDLIAYLRG